MINKVEKHEIDNGIKDLLGNQRRKGGNLGEIPIMLLGCKKDLIDKNRAQYILINAKVMQALKKLDAEKFVQYVETGISSTSSGFIRTFPQDELKVFLQKIFGSEIRLESHLNNEFEYSV